MKRYISIFLLNLICFVLQSTIFQQWQIAGITPNLTIIITAASGLMYGRTVGMFSGVIGGLFMDTMFSEIIGIDILIYAFIGYINGMATKLYFKEDFLIPIISIAASDFAYGLLYYICRFLLRGRLDFPFYLGKIIIPEVIYTVILGIVIYRFMRWLEEKLNPEQEIPLREREDK